MFKGCIASLVLLLSAPSWACVSFALDGECKLIIAQGYGMILGFGHGAVHVYPRGTPRASLVLKSEQTPVRWISKYGSVSLTQYGRGTTVGSINEKGLVIQSVRDPRGNFGVHLGLAYVNEGEWSQYQLDNYATVTDVVAGLPYLKIKRFFLGLQFMVLDPSGDRAIISFAHGQPVVYRNEEMPVAGMSPMPYKDLINDVPDATELIQEDDEDRAFGEPGEILGTGKLTEIMTPLKHLRSIFEQAKTRADSELVDYAFKVLARLNPRQKDPLERIRRMQGDWNVVYDVRDKAIFFRTAQSYELKYIHLNDLDFPQDASEKMADINLPVSGDFVPHLGRTIPLSIRLW